MKSITLVALAGIISAMMILSNIPLSESAISSKFVLSVKPETNPISVGDYPVITGSAKNEAYKPAPNAKIMISFASVITTVTTDDQGNFRYKSTIPAVPGTFAVNIVATKDGFTKGLASTTYTVAPKQITSQTKFKTLTGLPIKSGNYTVFLGKVTQWNLETTCFVEFGDKYMRFLKTCDLYTMAPQYFKDSQPVIPTVSVIQKDDSYRLFSPGIYSTSAGLDDKTLKTFVQGTWANYTAP